MRTLPFSAIALASLLLCGAELSANIDNLSNMSVEWLRTGARNGATDGTDIVIYNPAGPDAATASPQRRWTLAPHPRGILWTYRF